MTEHRNLAPELTYWQILKTWWPLAFSWLLMGFEIPAISAVIARLADPEINLAAFGGIVYPLALIVEAPIIMLLAASVALSTHQQAYRRIRLFMTVAGAVLTLAHALIAFTPLFDWIVRGLIHAPEEIVEPARMGFKMMLPWTWAIAYRRFQQGVLIRYGYSGAVGIGTMIRLVTVAAALALGYAAKTLSGSLVGAAALSMGVINEAVYAGLRVRPVLRNALPDPPDIQPLTWKHFAEFYIPLALTSLISLLWQPIGSAGLSRMPEALMSLAVWPVLSGLVVLLRSFGVAYNEAVVALLDREGAWRKLVRFTTWMAVAVTALHLIIAATPLSGLYFSGFSALSPELAQTAQSGFWLLLPMPLLAVLQNWFQGAILYGRRTRSVPESVAIYLCTAMLALGLGAAAGRWTGLYVAIVAVLAANVTQLVWLWLRSSPVMKQLRRNEPADERTGQ